MDRNVPLVINEKYISIWREYILMRYQKTLKVLTQTQIIKFISINKRTRVKVKILFVSRFLSPPVCSCPVLHDHGLHQNPEAIAAWNRMRVVLFVFVCVCG